MSGLTAEQVQQSMEQEIVHKVLEAKRHFMAMSKTANPRDVLKEYNITKDEIYFWFHTLYPTELEKYKIAIERLVCKE